MSARASRGSHCRRFVVMREDVRSVAAATRVCVRPRSDVVTALAPATVPGPVSGARRIRVRAAPNHRHGGWTGRAARSIGTHHDAGPLLPTSADVAARPPPTGVPLIADRRPRGCPAIPATTMTWTSAVRPARSTPHRGAGPPIGTTLPVGASGDRSPTRTRRRPTRPQARPEPTLRAGRRIRHRSGRGPPRARLTRKRRLPRLRLSPRTSRIPSPPTTRPRCPVTPRISPPLPYSPGPPRPQPPRPHPHPHLRRRASGRWCARRCATDITSRACWWRY